ncbi:MAG TPA: HAMP domain-containing protein [Candidatus Binatus sp.]|nr:HAMP domain-containing protein [Candidatus Binatus sp.]
MKRRLIGPTIITLLLCGLVADYLFLRESSWSVVNLITKIFSVFGAIFRPRISPEAFSWLGEFALPVAMILVAVVLLSLMVMRAKKAMREATSNPDVNAPVARQAAPRVSVQASELESVPTKPTGTSWRYPVVLKLAICFGGVGILFGVTVCIVVHSYFGRVFEKELRSRTQVTALGLSDVASRSVASKDLSVLSDAVDKIAASDAIAYLYVEDPNGQIIAYAPRDLLRFLNRDFPRSAERALTGVETQYRNSDVYEIAKRIGDAKGGFVHLAIWREAFGDEARGAVTPIAISIFVLILGSTGLFVFMATQLHRPFVELVGQAERISKGEFDVPLGLKREDEIGDIARSLERMRSSLHAVVRRLEQAQFPEQSGKKL